MTALLTDDVIAARLGDLAAGESELPGTPELPIVDNSLNEATPRHFRPLEEAAGEYVLWARHPERRIYTGIAALDEAMRGTAPGELTEVVGYAHSGKTIVTTQMLFANRDKHIAVFTPDETRVLVLVKLAAIVHNVSAEEFERRIAMRDQAAEQLLYATATEWFPKLAVFDQVVTLQQMSTALREAEDHWDAEAQAVVFDYADLLQGSGEDSTSKINAIKSWGTQKDLPMFLLHQSSRTKGAAGGKVGIDSGGYGGEQQATHMIGVRRKKNQLVALIEQLQEKIASQENPKPYLEDRLEAARCDLRMHQNTVTISLVKNKRPPGRLVDDLDFELDQATGRIVMREPVMRFDQGVIGADDGVGEADPWPTEDEDF